TGAPTQGRGTVMARHGHVLTSAEGGRPGHRLAARAVGTPPAAGWSAALRTRNLDVEAVAPRSGRIGLAGHAGRTQAAALRRGTVLARNGRRIACATRRARDALRARGTRPVARRGALR